MTTLGDALRQHYEAQATEAEPVELVDDPWRPGEKCHPSVADRDPRVRMGAALAGAMTTTPNEEG